MGLVLLGASQSLFVLFLNLTFINKFKKKKFIFFPKFSELIKKFELKIRFEIWQFDAICEGHVEKLARIATGSQTLSNELMSCERLKTLLLNSATIVINHFRLITTANKEITDRWIITRNYFDIYKKNLLFFSKKNNFSR